MKLDNTIQIIIAHIREGNIVSLKKRKSGIVIFKIQSFSHPGRHLIDKAENTMIRAGTIFVHKTVLKFNSKIILVFFFHFQFPFLAILLPDKERDKFVIHQITIVKHILYRLAINGKQCIPRFQFQFFSDTVRKNSGYYV